MFIDFYRTEGHHNFDNISEVKCVYDWTYKPIIWDRILFDRSEQ